MPRRVYADGRVKAKAAYLPRPDSPVCRSRPILLTTGKVDLRLTIEEAQRLQGTLREAIVAALSGGLSGTGGE